MKTCIVALLTENLSCILLTRQAEAQQGTVVDDRKLSERATARTPGTGVGGQHGEDVAVLHGLSALLQAPERRRTTAGPQDTQRKSRLTRAGAGG